MLREGGDGTAREVDILISHVFLGTKINIAIECRGRGRAQDIEWIDGLAGKFKRLNINKVIAVSPTQFTAGAREKAAEERIELLTVEDASKVDWASRLAKEAFSVGTHQNTLLNVSMWSPEGNRIALTTVDLDTNRVTHKDQRSELLYPYLVNTFMQKTEGCCRRSNIRNDQGGPFQVFSGTASPVLRANLGECGRNPKHGR